MSSDFSEHQYGTAQSTQQNGLIKRQVRIEPLADHPELAATIARWQYQEWSHQDPDGTLDKWIQHVQKSMNRDQIPLTLVAFQSHEPVGALVLVENHMPTRGDLTPWLARVFVGHRHRSRGVASALVQEAMQRAKDLGVKTLYLYTRHAEGLYEKLGWKVLEETHYQGRRVTIMYIRLND